VDGDKFIGGIIVALIAIAVVIGAVSMNRDHEFEKKCAAAGGVFVTVGSGRSCVNGTPVVVP